MNEMLLDGVSNDIYDKETKFLRAEQHVDTNTILRGHESAGYIKDIPFHELG